MSLIVTMFLRVVCRVRVRVNRWPMMRTTFQALVRVELGIMDPRCTSAHAAARVASGARGGCPAARAELGIRRLRTTSGFVASHRNSRTDRFWVAEGWWVYGSRALESRKTQRRCTTSGSRAAVCGPCHNWSLPALEKSRGEQASVPMLAN